MTDLSWLDQYTESSVKPVSSSSNLSWLDEYLPEQVKAPKVKSSQNFLQDLDFAAQGITGELTDVFKSPASKIREPDMTFAIPEITQPSASGLGFISELGKFLGSGYAAMTGYAKDAVPVIPPEAFEYGGKAGEVLAPVQAQQIDKGLNSAQESLDNWYKVFEPIDALVPPQDKAAVHAMFVPATLVVNAGQHWGDMAEETVPGTGALVKTAFELVSFLGLKPLVGEMKTSIKNIKAARANGLLDTDAAKKAIDKILEKTDSAIAEKGELLNRRLISQEERQKFIDTLYADEKRQDYINSLAPEAFENLKYAMEEQRKITPPVEPVIPAEPPAPLIKRDPETVRTKTNLESAEHMQRQRNLFRELGIQTKEDLFPKREEVKLAEPKVEEPVKTPEKTNVISLPSKAVEKVPTDALVKGSLVDAYGKGIPEELFVLGDKLGFWDQERFYNDKIEEHLKNTYGKEKVTEFKQKLLEHKGDSITALNEVLPELKGVKYKESLKVIQGSKESKPEPIFTPENIEKFPDIKTASEGMEFFGNKEFNSLQDAQVYFEKNRRVTKKREELQVNERDLQIVQVGEKFRVAEPLKMTIEEEIAFEKALRGEGEGTEIARRVAETTAELDPVVIEQKMRETTQEIQDWLGGKQDVDIRELNERILSLGEEARRSGAEGASLVETAEKIAQVVEAKIQEAFAPKKTQDPEVMVGLSPELKDADGRPVKVVFSPTGAPFDSPIDALEFMNKKRIVGAVVDNKGGGFVIKPGKPRPIELSLEAQERIKERTDKLLESLRLEELEEKKLLGNQAGFISTDLLLWPVNLVKGIKNFLKKNPEQIEGIRRVILDAAMAGKTVEQWALELGYSSGQAKALQQAAKEFVKQVDVSKPDVGTYNYSEGAPVNVGKLERKSGEHTVKRSVVTEGELRELQKIEKEPYSPGAKATQEFVPTPQRIREFNSPMLEDMHYSYLEAEKRIFEKASEFNKELNSMAKGIDNKSARNVGLHALWEQEDVRIRMEKDGFTQADIPTLTPREREFYNYLRTTLDEAFPRLNKVRTENGLPALRKAKNYFSIMYSEILAEHRHAGPNLFKDSIEAIEARHARFNEVSFKNLKSRSRKKLAGELDLNATEVFKKYMENAIRYEELTPLVSKISEMLEPLNTGKTKVNSLGKAVPDYFRLRKENPALEEFMRRWMNTLSSQDVDVWFKGNSFVNMWATKLTHNVATSLLTWNVRSMVVQTGAMKNTYAAIGLKATAQGIAELSPGKIREAVRESAVLKTRLSQESAIRELLDSTRRKEALMKKGTWAMNRVDFLCATGTFRGAKKYALAHAPQLIAEGKLRSTSNKDVVRFADKIVQATQGSSLKGDLAPIQRSALGKMITVLNTFTISDWNLMYKDMFGQRKGKSLTDRGKMRMIIDATIAGALINSLFEDLLNVNSPLPTPVRAAYREWEDGGDLGEIAGAVLGEQVERLPVLGGAIKYGGNIAGAVLDTLGKFFMSLKDWRNQNKRDNVGPTWEYAMKLRGVQGTGQITKMINRAQKKDDPGLYDITMGTKVDKSQKHPSSTF